MTKSASETTLKTSSTLNGIDNIDQIGETETLESLRARVAADRAKQKAEDQAHLDAALATLDALQTAEVAEDTLLEELVLLGNVDAEFNSSNLSWMLKVLQRSHNAMRFTGDLRGWALRTLCNWTEEEATPAVNIYMRTASVDEDWTIPELFHAVDLLPHYTDLVRLTLHYQKRFALYNQWADEARVAAEAKARAAVAPNHPSCVADMMAEVGGWQAADAVMVKKAALLYEAQKEAQAAVAKKEAHAAVMDITGLPGMAETAGIFAHSSALQGMSVAEAVQATITHLWVWDWATPAALAKREAARKEAQADAAEKEAVETCMNITGRPGMAEVAGWHAHDAVSRHGMSVAEAVQSAIKHFSMWTWATPAARAKRAAASANATRFVDGITPGMSEEARAAHVAGAVAEAIAAFPVPPAGTAKPPPLVLKVPEFKEITDPGAQTPSLEWLAAAPAPIFFYPPLSSENHVFDPHAQVPSGNQTPMPPGSLCRG
jgi:hypothetical protein